MKTEQFTLEGFGGQLLPAYLWLPEGEVKCVLQITHGMTEHMGRYQRFAEDLTRQGVAVAGFDLRGHGRNGGDPQVASLGQGGWAASIADMRLLFRLLSQRFAQLPHYMLGFSLGSFLLREYLQTDSTGVAGAIIVGTGHQPAWLLSLMMGIVKGQIQSPDLTERRIWCAGCPLVHTTKLASPIGRMLIGFAAMPGNWMLTWQIRWCVGIFLQVCSGNCWVR